MRLMSAWKLWNRLMGKPGPPENARAEESEAQLSQAVRGLRTESVRIPSWEKIEELILTGKKEQPMSAVSRNRVFAVSRKVALIASASAVVLLAFFAIPFSQSNPLGANIVFEFTSSDPNCCAGLNISDAIDDPSWGITECKVSVRQSSEDLVVLELLVLTENGIVPDELVARLKQQNPILANAQVTVNPVTERSTGTAFQCLIGSASVSLDCEGKTADQIEAEVKAALQAQGVQDPRVQVEKIQDGERTKIKIRIEVEDDK